MKTILITGGTGGLGSAVVPRLARGYHCVVVHRDSASFAHLREIENVEGTDQPGGGDQPLFAIVSLAGAFREGSSAGDFESMFDANLFSIVHTLDAASPRLQDEGRIVAISAAASLTKPAGLAAYSASKAALNATIETLARDLAPRRITANALLPTALDTPAMRASGAKGLVPLDTVAEWIEFLLSPAGSAVTGQLIRLSA